MFSSLYKKNMCELSRVSLVARSLVWGRMCVYYLYDCKSEVGNSIN
jgi:hypothetical protein